MKNTIYFRRWSKNKVAFIIDGDCYDEAVVHDTYNKTFEEIREYLIRVHAINSDDELIEI